jgi:hypothetical protein
LVILILGLAAPLLAGEGRIPIWQYPTTISAPGKYVVTRNINSGGGPNPIIQVQAGNVDIDLNGFTLDNTGSPMPVIDIVSDFVDVVIRNGILVGGSESILRGPGAGVESERVVVEDVQIRRPDMSAVHIWGIREVVIRRVNIIDPGAHGVWLERNTGFTNGTVEHCAIRLPGTDGIHVDRGSSFSVRHNRIEVPVNHGIHMLGCYAPLVGENTISDADGIAIFFEQTNGGKIYNNVVSRGETHGIVIDGESGDNFLLDNIVRQSGWAGAPGPGFGGGHGILVDGFRNHLEKNTVNESDACGIIFNGPDNTYGRNMARANDPTGSFCNAASCMGLFPPDSCDNGPNNTSYGDNLIPGPPLF